MKKLLLSGAVLALVFVGGCVVQSVYPYYTAKDLVFDPALKGTWSEKDKDPEPGESWIFESLGEKGYWLTVTEKAETNRYEAHLFRLKQESFLDLCLTNRSEGMLPLHMLLKVPQIQPTLKFQLMNLEWLGKLLEKDPKAIRHVVVQKEPGKSDKSEIVLTADTKELQAFVLKYSSDTNAFTEPTEMKKR